MSQKWFELFKKQKSIPVAAQSTDRYFYFALRLDKINFEADNKSKYSISAYLFDTRINEPFGIIYNSDHFDTSAVQSNQLMLERTLCFYTSFESEDVKLIVELENNNKCIAWTRINVFTNWTALTDVALRKNPEFKNVGMTQGSSKLLFVQMDQNNESSHFVLSYSFQTHNQLQCLVHLLPENMVFGSDHLLPGSNGTNYLQPSCLETTSIILDEISIDASNSILLEELICETIANDRLALHLQRPADAIVTIVEYKLNIAIHNGLQIVKEPDTVSLTSDGKSQKRRPSAFKVPSKSTNNAKVPSHYLQAKTKFEIEGLFHDPALALVFIVEYVVSIDCQQPAQTSSSSVFVAWVAWSPFSDQKADEGQRITLNLQSGHVRNPFSQLCFNTWQNVECKDLTIQFQCSLGHSKKNFNQSEKMPLSPTSESFSSLNSSSRHVPPPPTTVGRAPLDKVIKGSIEPSLSVSQDMQVIEPRQFHESIQEHQRRSSDIKEVIVDQQQPETLIAMQNQQYSSPMISRGNQIVLMNYRFMQICDRNGESADAVDLGFSGSKLRMELELDDLLKTNEIIFELLAISLPRNRKIRSIFCTLQFYRFDYIHSERLLLNTTNAKSIDGSQLFVLGRQDYATRLPISGLSGYQIKFVLDGNTLNIDEHKNFFHYLNTNAMHIDVWDADSLILVGSALLPLKSLLRCGKEAVIADCQLPLFATMINTHFDQKPFKANENGNLLMRLANVGYPSSVQNNHGSQSVNRTIMSHILHTETDKGRKLIHPNSVAQNLGTQYPELNTIISSRRNYTSSEALSTVKQKQIAAIQRLHGQGFDRSKNNMRDTMERDINTIKRYQAQIKPEAIENALLQMITTVHTIYPNVGSVEFFEFLVTNSTNSMSRWMIEISDIDLIPVIDLTEWRFMKHLYNIQTPIEESLFQKEADNLYLFLRPNESVYIPFKYRQEITSDDQFKPKKIKVSFRDRVDNKIQSMLLIVVEPQPNIIKQTFRFYHMEHSVWAKYLRFQTNYDLNRLSVTSDDPNVLCSLHETEHRSTDIFMKTVCGASPSVKSFCILLYADKYRCKPIEMWKIFIHLHQHVDLVATQGQIVKQNVVFSPSQTNCMVQYFSSEDTVVQIIPSGPIYLSDSHSKEMQLIFKPTAPGQQLYQVTAVDVENEKLLKSWLFSFMVNPPQISRAFQVTLPVQVSDMNILTKRIQFKNPYKNTKEFHVFSSDDSLMLVKQSVILLEPDQNASVALLFTSSNEPLINELFLFINDQYGNVEQTYGVKCVFGKF